MLLTFFCEHIADKHCSRVPSQVELLPDGLVNTLVVVLQ